MDSTYQNTDFVLSTFASDEKPAQYKGNSTKDQEIKREVSSSTWTKVLLIGLTVSLVFALLGLCFLGIKFVAREHEELAANDTRVAEHLFINNILMRELKDNYTRDRQLLASHEEKLRKLNRFNESTGCALCAVNWIHSGGKCYYFSTYTMNWTQSRDQCVTLGGHLVIIDSGAEQDFLTSNVKVTHWIGLSDLNVEGNWIWVNNQPLNDSVEFWMKRENGMNEPDNWIEKHADGEDCCSLGYVNGGTEFWTDAYCSEMKRFACEPAAAV